MKIKTIILSAPVIAFLVLAGCSPKEHFTLNLTLEPAAKSLAVQPGFLPVAAEVIRKRVTRLGIRDENLKIDVTSDRIKMVITDVDTSAVMIIKNLAIVSGNLGLWETYENKDVFQFLNAANQLLANMKAPARNSEPVKPDRSVSGADTASADQSMEEMLKMDKEISAAEDSSAVEFRLNNPLFGILIPRFSQDGEPLPSCMIGLAKLADTAKINFFLKMDTVAALFPRDLKFCWGRYPYKYDDTKTLYELHAIKVTTRDGLAPLDGDIITSVKAVSKGGETRINFTMNAEGARMWARMTRENVDRCIALIIDGYVRSYPRVMNEITGGNTELTGDFTVAEGKYLSFLLGSGGNGLPVKLRVSEENIVKAE
jgi:SecD/SecF fusion protein